MESEVVSKIILNTLKREFNQLPEEDLRNLAGSLQGLILPKPTDMKIDEKDFVFSFSKSFLRTNEV